MWAESTAFWNMLDGLRKDLSSQRHSGALRKLACLSRAKTFMSYYFTPFSVPQALHYVSRIADPIVQDGKVQSDPMDVSWPRNLPCRHAFVPMPSPLRQVWQEENVPTIPSQDGINWNDWKELFAILRG